MLCDADARTLVVQLALNHLIRGYALQRIQHAFQCDPSSAGDSLVVPGSASPCVESCRDEFCYRLVVTDPAGFEKAPVLDNMDFTDIV
ncbi:unnamed protein product [Soboliphyme baturini]|uniref:Uncharacterized protein n=1 Tax=Soboliphyme baturini TaxID=241478 RepID=A0A183IX30_9BILA|nr:unnamed protein product [Soboliphyme baturini]